LSHAGVVTSQRTVALAYGTLINGRWRASAMRRWALGRPISRVGPGSRTEDVRCLVPPDLMPAVATEKGSIVSIIHPRSHVPSSAVPGPAPSVESGRTLLVAASLLLVGVASAIASNAVHPGRQDPMDNPRVFLEYAASDSWVAAHLGQFVGYLLTFAGLIVLCHLLASDDRGAAVTARLAVAMGVAGIAVAAVLQGVDGISLKATVDGWAEASGAQRTAAFSAAEAVRWIEIGVNSTFRLIQGATVALVVLALASSGRFPGWLGWFGAFCGAAVLLRGVAVTFVGFDMSNPVYVATGAVASNFPVTLLNLWMVVLAVVMWRSSSQISRGGAGVPAPEHPDQ
jgi:hypothetical protein